MKTKDWHTFYPNNLNRCVCVYALFCFYCIPKLRCDGWIFFRFLLLTSESSCFSGFFSLKNDSFHDPFISQIKVGWHVKTFIDILVFYVMPRWRWGCLSLNWLLCFLSHWKFSFWNNGSMSSIKRNIKWAFGICASNKYTWVYY